MVDNSYLALWAMASVGAMIFCLSIWAYLSYRAELKSKHK